MTWVVVVGGLLLLVFLHEVGHFSVALAVGVRPRSFYVGFPPALFKFRRKGIEYGLGAIPLGGMVRIPGMNRPAGRDVEAFMAGALREDPALAPFAQRIRRSLDAGDLDGARATLPDLREQLDRAELTPGARRSANRAVREIDEGTGADAYWRQPTWKRVAIIAAGPLMNILVAFVLFLGVYATGAPTGNPTTTVATVSSGTPAAAAGLRPDDRIVAVSGHRAATFDALSKRIRASHGRPITLTVVRNGARVTLGPRRTILAQGKYIWGFSPGFASASHPIGASARLAARDCWRVLSGTVSAFAGLVHAKQRSEVSGPVGIVRTSAIALRLGFNWYLQILGLISMSLAILNLLPLLPLDGGHILFSLIEAVRRRALAREVYERVSVAGLMLIGLIWVIALSNDFSSGVPH
ncbi:MAG TPA: M50 family metallopeptidase [Gaiellaceae bacterium]|nr:M50 family metallopeptidase [Gaiellaceae bacterium]